MAITKNYCHSLVAYGIADQGNEMDLVESRLGSEVSSLGNVVGNVVGGVFKVGKAFSDIGLRGNDVGFVLSDVADDKSMAINIVYSQTGEEYRQE